MLTTILVRLLCIGRTIASACLDAGIIPVTLDSLVPGRREFTMGRAVYKGDISDGPRYPPLPAVGRDG